MGVFGDIANSETYESGGNYFIPGNYQVEVRASYIEPSAKNKKVKHAKVKCKVIEYEAVGDGSKEGRYKPGAEVNFVVEVTKEMGASNAKAYAMAAGEQALWQAGADAEAVREFLRDFKASSAEPHPCEKHLEDIFGIKSSAIGVKIRVEAFNKNKTDGNPFTRLRWVVTDRPDDFDPKSV